MDVIGIHHEDTREHKLPSGGIISNDVTADKHPVCGHRFSHVVLTVRIFPGQRTFVLVSNAVSFCYGGNEFPPYLEANEGSVHRNHLPPGLRESDSIYFSIKNCALKGEVMRTNTTAYERKVKKRLIDLGMTQTELAAQIGTTRQYLRKILIGERTGEKYREEIDRVLGISNVA